jgi:hypothetical protein
MYAQSNAGMEFAPQAHGFRSTMRLARRIRFVVKSLAGHAKPVSWGVLIAGILVWSAGAAVFFRHSLFSFFDATIGDGGDGRMLIYLHEHLFNALRGRASLTSPPFYFPQQDTLGLGPAFLLDLIPYSILRLLGFDPFLSFQVLLMLLSLACFLAILVICIRYLDVRIGLALCAAALTTFANNLFVKAGVGHPNLLLLYFCPCIAVVTLWGLDDFPRITARSLARIAVAAALYALLFATDVYSAWMFGLTVLIAGGICVCLCWRDVVWLAREHHRSLLVLGATAALSFAVAFVPFLLIYLPVRSIAPLRDYREYIGFAPGPFDIVNVSSWNLVWGWLVKALPLKRGSEHILAITPGMTALFLIFAYKAYRASLTVRQWQVVFVAAAVGVWGVCWLATVKIGTVSGFWLVRYLVPGALGIRAGMRIQLIANMWVVLALVVALEHWLNGVSAVKLARRKVIAGAVLAFCLVEQINLLNNSRISRRQEFAALASVPPPPAECRAFVVDARNGKPHYLDQTDALWISQQTGLPTLHGLAGWFPPGWRLLSPGDYPAAIRNWIAHSGLREQVCLYERSARRWSHFQ